MIFGAAAITLGLLGILFLGIMAEAKEKQKQKGRGPWSI